MRLRRNPFEILGIAPEMVRDLDDEALFNLVKACYRALQRAFHPDLHPGHRERAVEINLAFEALDLERDPDSFREYRQAYLRRLSRRTQKRTIENLTQQVALLLRQRELLQENYWRHLLEVFRLRPGPTLFPHPPRGIKVTLLDVSLRFNVSFSGFGRSLAFKEILFDHEGALYYRFPRKRKFQPVRFLTLVGSVPRDHVEIWPLLVKKATAEATVGLPNPKAFEVLNLVETEVFKRACLPLLRLELSENAYLFSLRQKTGLPEAGVYLEGMVLKVEEAKPKDFDKVVKNTPNSLQERKFLPVNPLALEE